MNDLKFEKVIKETIKSMRKVGFLNEYVNIFPGSVKENHQSIDFI